MSQPSECFLYRVSHKYSAGCVDREVLASASWRARGSIFLHQWMHDKAEAHFSKHFDLENRKPTMFLSTTDDLLRALNLASGWYQNGYEDVLISIIDLGAPGSDDRARFLESHSLTHAEAVAKTLGWEEFQKYRTEWLFLGRIERRVVVKQIHYQHLMDHGLYNTFPSVTISCPLNTLREQIVHDFRVLGSNQTTLSRLNTDTGHPTQTRISQQSGNTEAGWADGRRCAQFAALFDLNLPEERLLARALMLAAWRWKRSAFYPNADYDQAFHEAALMYVQY